MYLFLHVEINNILRSIGKSLKDYPQLPQPPEEYLCHGLNNLILDETSYDRELMHSEYQMLYNNCNDEQKVIFHDVMRSIENGQGGVFFCLR